MRLPLDRFCNAIYYWIIQRIDPEELPMFLTRLHEPTPGRGESPESIKQEMDSFALFASSFGVTPPESG